MDDREIIELFWNRDEEAILEVEEKYGAYCHTIANRLLKDSRDVEECVIDTWNQVWHAIPPRRPGNLRLFLGKIIRNLVLDRLKKENADKRGGGKGTLLLEELAECVPSVTDIQRQTEDRELGRSINRFLLSLPAKDCNIFLARYWYGHSIREISHACMMGEGTVKSHLFRTRQKLKVFLEKEGVIV